MTTYSVTWKDLQGQTHSQSFDSDSPSAALATASDKIELLRTNPNLIERVLPEAS